MLSKCSIPEPQSHPQYIFQEQTFHQGMAVHACNLSTQEAETEELLQVQGHPGKHSNLQASQGLLILTLV